MLSKVAVRRLMTHRTVFTKVLSTKGSLSYLTEENVMVGNDNLLYQEGDVFSLLNKITRKYGNKKAVVSIETLREALSISLLVQC